jgi:hypothetical protein
MKRNFKNIILVALSILALASCGKYGYNFEDGYDKGDPDASGIDTDTTMSVADKSLYHRARIYPGLVGDNVKRIADTLITFDMDYVYVSSNDLKVNVVPKPIFSTGLYAPAGENIKITVPAGVTGLRVQVGVHTDNLTGKDPLRRDPVIFTVKELFPGVNYVKNLYGGTIWISTNNSRPAPVALRFAGAVRSPDFILGKTNVQDWLIDVEQTQVPWLEVRSERVIFSIPRNMVINYKADAANVEGALTEWNEIYQKDFYDWMGLQPNATDLKNRYPDLPERAMLDIQPSVGYAHNGNPWVAQADRHWFRMFTDRNYILNPNNLSEVSWGAFHELGHNYQQGDTWSWSGLGETTNNLFIWKAANRLNRLAIANHPAIPDAFQVGLEYTAKTTGKNIITDPETSTGSHPFVKILLFLQIYNKAVGKNGESGWDFMPYIYNKARNTNYSFTLDEAKRDFFYRNLCEFTGKDYQKFCRAWGIQISALARREMAALYPPLEKAIWTYNPLTNTGGEDPINPKEDIDFSEWTILAKSTEEPTGEGANNGQAIRIIDGNTSSFWHSQWSAATATLPHSITFSLKSNEIVKGFYLVPRTNSVGQRPKSIEIQLSKDNSNYTTLTNDDLEAGYSFNMPNTADRKEFRLKSSIEIRFVKIFFRENNHSGSSHHAVSEFGAFIDID